MFDNEDKEYFARRARAARANETAAQDPGVKRVHRELAEEYERRAQGEVPRPISRLPS